VDLEFFDSAFLFRDRAGFVPEETRDLGVEGVEFVADLLERNGARGTFFVLGEVAEQDPDLIADLADRDHEIASHGYSKSHPDLREIDRNEVERELEASKRILQEVTGTRVKGFRAPAFAMDDSVMDVVAALGYAYDSSVVPSRRIPGFYGSSDAPTEPFPSGEFFSADGVFEYPVSVAPYLKLPLSGAWMRLLGRRYALWGLRGRMRRDPVSVVYVHPWELVDLPRYDVIPNRVYWRTGEYTRRTLESMVSEHAEAITTLEDIPSRADTETEKTAEGGSRDVVR
jgi:peptidoglycan/xylan/chitin deacetylase (PgdA/CDA1 family)